jgi:signal transduction histidine kinase
VELPKIQLPVDRRDIGAGELASLEILWLTPPGRLRPIRWCAVTPRAYREFMQRWLADTGRAAGSVFAGVFVAGLTVLAVMVLFVSWIWSFAALFVVVGLSPIYDVLWIALIVANPWLLWWILDRLGDVQRARLRLILREPIPAPPQVTFRDLVRLRNPFVPWRMPSTYRQFVYHVSGAVINGLGAALILTGALAWLPVIADWWLSLSLVPLVLGIPIVARGTIAVDRAAGRALLGPTKAQQLSRRVDDLARSRAEVVAATDAERRRIERDLHDGPQQRLVSLAMNLGMARERLTDESPLRAAIESAHDEALAALTELRQFVRELHPAVLNDRGLDAALSGIAARAPLPVRLTVDIPVRCSPTVEAIAYFVVSEALTNVAKHAQATRADVTVERVGDQLFVSVIDDGRGGARLDSGDGLYGGTGLRGLGRRAAAVDGTLAIHSPHGGPTAITVVLPCES